MGHQNLHHKRLNNLTINKNAKIITTSIVTREQGRDNGGALAWYLWHGVDGNWQTVTTLFQFFENEVCNYRDK